MPVLQYNLIAIAAGLLAGLLQGALTLPSGGGLLLAYIAPLPLFLAGLGLGLRGGLIAAAVSGVLSLLFAGLPYAGTQAMVYSLPVIILCRQALLSRNDNAGQAHWYPPGHLLLWLSGMAIAGLVAVLAITTIFDDGLMAYLDSIMAPIAAQLKESARYWGVIGSSNSVAVGMPRSNTSPRKDRASRNPPGISQVPLSWGSIINPFQPTVVRGFSKYTRIKRNNRSSNSRERVINFSAYSRQAVKSCIEQGPTTPIRRRSRP